MDLLLFERKGRVRKKQAGTDGGVRLNSELVIMLIAEQRALSS
jgi:hypothetical protein